MRRLITRHVIARLGNESGVTIVFIAVVLLGLIAMTAFVIDFGRIWQERRELQTGATAAVLAIAEDCAWDLCDGGYSEFSTADQYADANAGDGAAAISTVNLDLGAQTVYVEAATENEAGGSNLDMLFAPVLGFDSITIGADAEAAWGTPLDANTLPIIMSDCEWMRTDSGWPAGGAVPLPSPQAVGPGSGYQTATIFFHDPQGGDECTVPPGLNLPGGFGWVDQTTGCSTDIVEDDWIGSDPGAAPPNPCRTAMNALLGEVVKIPYFKNMQGQGNNGQYQIAGHGAFVFAGYRFPGASGGVQGCSAPDTCITGWFVSHVTHGGGPGGFGGEDRGVVTIKLIG